MKLTPVSMTAGILYLFSERAGKFYLYNLQSRNLRPISPERFNFKAGTHAITDSSELVFFDNATGSFISLNIQSGHSSRLKKITLSSPPAKLIAAGKSKLWFIEQSLSVAGSFDMASMEVKEYFVPPGASLSDVVASNNGQVWLTDAGRNKIIKIENGWLTEYTIPTSFSSPQGLSIGPDGQVWFTESVANKIGLLQDGRFEEYAAPPDSEPASPRIDSQGNLWFIGRRSGKLGFLPAEMMRRLSSPPAQVVYQPCLPSAESPTTNEKTGISRGSH
jgi:streptogramin lyase